MSDAKRLLSIHRVACQRGTSGLLIGSLVVLGFAIACSKKPEDKPPIVTPKVSKPLPLPPKSKKPPKKKLPKVDLDCGEGTLVTTAIARGVAGTCRDVNGINHGTYRELDLTGKTRLERTYVRGRLKGELKVYEAGELVMTGSDRDDLLDSFKYVDAKAGGPNVDALIKGELNRAAVCGKGDKCVVLRGVCPFGCDLVVNATHKARVSRWLKGYRAGCAFKCKPTAGKPACIDNTCQVSNH